MKKLLLSSIFACLFSSTASAGSGWSQTGTVDQVYNLGWTILVKISGEGKSYGNCPSSAYYAINVDDSARFNVLYSQILMAHASKKTTVLWILGDSCTGQGNSYQKISSIKTS